MKRLLVGLLLVNGSCWALSERSQVEYRRANESDVQSILSLMEEASTQGDKILILPKACREAFAKEIIDKKYLFVAVVNKEVVATKKLFIAEGTEKDDLLKDLIRSEGKKARPFSYRGKISDSGSITRSSDQRPAYGVCLYVGFEYTKKAYRGQGINKQLTEFAYGEVAEQVKGALRKLLEKNLTLIYGVTYPNANEQPDMAPDRTPGMAKTFQTFIKKYIDKQASSVVLELTRYHGFMPTFDQNSQDCTKPYPDEKSDPIYGYLLTYELKGDLV